MSSHKRTDFKKLIGNRLSSEKKEVEELAEKGITPITETGFVGSGDSLLYEIPMSLIDPDENQVRKSYNEETINELAQSINQVGLLQPIIVIKSGERFKLITGHRRYFAYKKLNLGKIKAIIKIGLTEKDSKIFQLTENLQRENLDPIDEALGLKKIMDENNLSQQTLGQIMSKDKTYISKTLGIIKLVEKFASGLLQQNSEVASTQLARTQQNSFAELQQNSKVASTQLSGIPKQILVELSQNLDFFNENNLKLVIEKIKNENLGLHEMRKILKSVKDGRFDLTEKSKQRKDFEEKIKEIINTTKEISDKVMKLKIQFGKEISQEIEEDIRLKLTQEANRFIELISALFKGKATIGVNLTVDKPKELFFPITNTPVTIGDSLSKIDFSFIDYSLSKAEVIKKIRDRIPTIQESILNESDLEFIIDHWNAMPFQKIERNVDGFYFKALKSKFNLPARYIEMKDQALNCGSTKSKKEEKKFGKYKLS